jgi:hypothetical protein
LKGSKFGQKQMGRRSMLPLQYVIDSLCSSVTAECVYKMVEASLGQEPFKISELLPLILSKDRSLDAASAKMIAKAALDDMEQRGLIRIDGDNISARN